MTFLSDKALERLQALAETPDLSGTPYRLLGRVARGGMGVVYAAQDMKLGRRVALKILDLPGHAGGLQDRLVREARILARLEHPGIVPVHDVGTLTDERIFYTMKFVEGQPLDEYVKTIHSIADRLRLLLRICDAVSFAHARGVLHRDLKPANIMAGPFGEILVMDWGLAKVFTESADNEGMVARGVESQLDGAQSAATPADPLAASPVTGHGTVLGTPGYMSPEQARGDVEQLDVRSDLYSLGAILRFLLETSAAGAVSRTSQRDKSLRAICAKAMAVDPQERYANVTDFAADVSAYLDGRPVNAYRESFLERCGRFYRRHSIAILLITAYLLMRVLVLLFFRR